MTRYFPDVQIQRIPQGTGLNPVTGRRRFPAFFPFARAIDVTYTYDDANRLCQIVDAIGVRTNMTYDTGPVVADADEPVVIETKPEKRP